MKFKYWAWLNYIKWYSAQSLRQHSVSKSIIFFKGGFWTANWYENLSEELLCCRLFRCMRKLSYYGYLVFAGNVPHLCCRAVFYQLLRTAVTEKIFSSASILLESSTEALWYHESSLSNTLAHLFDTTDAEQYLLSCTFMLWSF